MSLPASADLSEIRDDVMASLVEQGYGSKEASVAARAADGTDFEILLRNALAFITRNRSNGRPVNPPPAGELCACGKRLRHPGRCQKKPKISADRDRKPRETESAQPDGSCPSPNSEPTAAAPTASIQQPVATLTVTEPQLNGYLMRLPLGELDRRRDFITSLPIDLKQALAQAWLDQEEETDEEPANGLLQPGIEQPCEHLRPVPPSLRDEEPGA